VEPGSAEDMSKIVMQGEMRGSSPTSEFEKGKGWKWSGSGAYIACLSEGQKRGLSDY